MALYKSTVFIYLLAYYWRDLKAWVTGR